jgi:subtilase family serine protease
MKKLLLCASVFGGLSAVSSVPAAAAAGPATLGAGQSVHFNVMLPLRNRDTLEAAVADLHNPNSPNFHRWLTPAQFNERFGPDKAAIARVAASLRARGFAVEEHARSLHVSGAAELVSRTFATTLAPRTMPSGHVLVAATAPIHAPAEIAAEHASVVGLEGLERRPMSHVVTGKLPEGSADNRYGNVGHYYYDDLKQAYVYPAVNSTVTPKGGTATPFNGTGVTIGALMENDVLDSDIKLIFDHENYSTTTGKPDPTLFLRRPINGGAPFDPNASFEASLDVQAELTGAPGAHVVLYNIPNLSDANIIDGYTAIVEDNLVDVVSSSFGGCEADYLPKYNHGVDGTATLQYEHELYLQGNMEGITFLASSGDEAGKICPSGSYYPNGKNGVFQAGASSPATDPAVTGVGGTNLVTVYDVGTLNSTYAGENAWADQRFPYDPYGFGNGSTVKGGVWGAGGGASVVFAAPAYQSLVTTGSTMRMTPDVGMQVGGCPGGASDYNPKLNVCNGGNLAVNGNGNTDRSYYVVALNGGRYGVIGTSVSSPEFASAVALLVEKNGRMGNLNSYIYKLAAAQAKGGRRAFHTLIPGWNGLIPSNISSTYNVSTGVGTPIVKSFIDTTVGAAGTPQTPSNP